MHLAIRQLKLKSLLFACAAILLTSVVWATGVRHDGLYVCKPERETYTKVLRFYQDRTVIGITTSDSINTIARGLRRGGSDPLEEYKYTITGSQIKFTFEDLRQSLDYEGIISGDVIDFKVHNRDVNKDFLEKYEFVKVDLRPDKPVENVVRTKIKVEGIELGEWITEIVYYDEYQRPARSDLLNRQGVIVARRGRIFYANALIQSMLAIGGPLKPGSICDIDPRDVFFVTSHNPQGNPIIPRFLCLDANGDLIMNGKRPLMVNSFAASQNSESKITYNVRGFNEMTHIRIFPCGNCTKQTGNSKIIYVW